jgi:hypothetical protein
MMRINESNSKQNQNSVNTLKKSSSASLNLIPLIRPENLERVTTHESGHKEWRLEDLPCVKFDKKKCIFYYRFLMCVLSIFFIVYFVNGAGASRDKSGDDIEGVGEIEICENNDSVSDSFGDTCSTFYDDFTNSCGEFDDSEFVASDACCACQDPSDFEH